MSSRCCTNLSLSLFRSPLLLMLLLPLFLFVPGSLLLLVLLLLLLDTMSCTGRPLMFGTMSPFEIIPQWGSRCGSGPWAGRPMGGFGQWGERSSRGFRSCGGQTTRGLLQEVFGNIGDYQGSWENERPSCLDHSGRRYCRTHCHGHCNPDNLQEQFIIGDIIRNTHKTQAGDSTHCCKDNGSETEESKVNETKSKENDSNIQVKNSNQSRPDDVVTTLPKLWSVEVDMNGCDEVRAWTEDGKIMVEGHTRNTHGFMSVQWTLSLPSHIRGEALVATLGREGKLTLREAQAEKDNQAIDTPVQKEQDIQIISKEQIENEDIQKNLVDKENSEVNMNESDLLKSDT